MLRGAARPEGAGGEVSRGRLGVVVSALELPRCRRRSGGRGANYRRPGGSGGGGGRGRERGRSPGAGCGGGPGGRLAAWWRYNAPGRGGRTGVRRLLQQRGVPGAAGQVRGRGEALGAEGGVGDTGGIGVRVRGVSPTGVRIYEGRERRRRRPGGLQEIWGVCVSGFGGVGGHPGLAPAWGWPWGGSVAPPGWPAPLTAWGQPQALGTLVKLSRGARVWIARPQACVAV